MGIRNFFLQRDGQDGTTRDSARMGSKEVGCGRSGSIEMHGISKSSFSSYFVVVFLVRCFLRFFSSLFLVPWDETGFEFHNKNNSQITTKTVFTVWSGIRMNEASFRAWLRIYSLLLRIKTVAKDFLLCGKNAARQQDAKAVAGWSSA